ncbi:HAMP domain-containing histidine kinase [Bdellovibrio sp. SKB1291214]|uniref:sensor histidine kinase n=1 Tax=Bdellovibrio sp. SKB1291214 TaxID=1732569 RepID=UPI000B517642|nr:HAMP domain-containing sensor histidine kinase [Bdellovibrio sp. SKB1291214]UYL09102.1 HAMP domain-containing histidine kinase [Bdellovibrio sp. SKB1291214]
MSTNTNNTEVLLEENKQQESSPVTNKSTFERKALLILSAVFVAVLVGAWGYAMRVRESVASNSMTTHADPTALIEVERLRNLASSQLDNSRAYFLLGSQTIYDKQKKEKESLMDSLAVFEKEHNLPGVSDVVKRIKDIETKNQEFFDQAVEHREKKTESKIVGQFYQARTSPLRSQLNEAFDDIIHLHQIEIDKAKAEIKDAANQAETQIPFGMTWLTGSLTAIFLGMAFLVLRLVRRQSFQLAQQKRLYEEAKKAVQDRDETLFAISHDLQDSLKMISNTAERMATTPQGLNIVESGEFVKSTVATIEGMIKDIRDQKNMEMNGLTLRMDQLSIDDVLDNARLLMQPLAKQHDVRLQIDSVNPPVLAFYDNERVMRVLANLIGNAIKFSPKGEKVVVKVRSDQKFVNISVIDNGPGIPASQLPNIFENFWQAKKTADKGAGLGLAIVKTIVEAHGGTVQIQSQTGRGTTVTFSLPRRRPVGASLKKPNVTVKHSGATAEWQ